MAPPLTRWILGLGTSLGDPAVLELAARLLDASGATLVRGSRIWLSPPDGGVARNPFHNAAIQVRWGGTPAELLALCKHVERRLGRKDTPRWGDRVLDVDLLWASSGPHRAPGLRVPHPRLAERPFAWLPAAEVGLPRERCGSLVSRPRPTPVGVLPSARSDRYPRLHTGASAMKFFIDTANLDEIRTAARWGIVDGVTTNPSLIAKEGRDFIDTIAEICTIVDGPVSAEVVAEDAETMVRQGKLLARVHENVVVKVPLTVEGITATSRLSAEGIKTNVTLCFQPMQALLAAKAGATYISPFIGRIDDVSWGGTELIAQIVEIYANYPELHTQVLAASIRHPAHMVECALAGADVATIPFGAMRKLFDHPLTDIGNAKFTKAWEGVPNSDIEGQVTAWLAKNGR